MNIIIALFTSYLLGSIPFGLLIARWVKGIDIRQHGSGNIGTTNVFRVVGKGWGIFVFALDAFKGFMGVMIACGIAGQEPGSSLSLLFAVTSILGHTFPVWLSFKGGKGVATSLGVFLAAATFPTLIAFGVWIVVFIITHIVSISSLFAAPAFFLSCLIFFFTGHANPILIPISLALGGFIFYTHRENIKRIRAGEEKKLF